MTIDVDERNLTERIKFFAARRGYTMKTLCEEFNQRFGTKYAQPSFSRKINNQAVSWSELKQFGELLGFKIKFEPID